MLLTISTTHQPPGDLGYLLHKHPAKLQQFPLSFGSAHVFYPRLDDEACTAALLLEIDPIRLVRGGREQRTLDQYVNDRPYVASSFLSVAISQVFGTALAGNCKERPELVNTPIPLVARIASLPCRGGEALLRRLFEPLGYRVVASQSPLAIQAQVPPGDSGCDSEGRRIADWGPSLVHTVELSGTVRLTDLLSHLYVLIPVLDNDKHYWVGDDEVQKLLRHGEGWLPAHPERELIAARYLRYRRDLATEAVRQLREQDEESPDAIDADRADDPRERAGERALSLHEQRHGVIASVLAARRAQTVLDLGCGEGGLIRALLKNREIKRLVGVDVSHRTLGIAADRLRLDRMPALQRERIQLVHGSLVYRDRRLEAGGEFANESGFDAAVLCEVIEHIDPPRLPALERIVFEHIRPRTVIVTTPNREYNVMWAGLAAQPSSAEQEQDTTPEEAARPRMRHRDHRFEWDRDQFRQWASGVSDRFGYSANLTYVGDSASAIEGKDVGSPTQVAVFRLTSS